MATKRTASTASGSIPSLRQVARAGNAVKPIVGKIGDRALIGTVKGRSFMHGLVEAIKNSIDWKANQIWISFPVHNQLRVVDDGWGMGEKNRDAFVSWGETSAGSDSQTGIFDSGSKGFLVTYASQVEVRTVPEEDSEHVYIFTFSAAEAQRLALTGEERYPTILPKTPETWPYPFKCGTELTYTLVKPEARAILRGDKLAEALSARLPWRFSDVVKVEGKFIPSMAMQGSYARTFQLPFGEVVFEIYRPSRPHKEHALRVALVEIGEVPIVQLCKPLGDDLRARFPDILLLGSHSIAGMISVNFSRKYINESRDKFDEAIADDPKTHALIRLFEKEASAIQRALKIEMHHDSGSDADRARMDEIADLFNQVYRPPNVYGGPGVDQGGDLPPRPPPADEGIAAFRLTTPRPEYEIGDEISVDVIIHSAFRDRYSLDSITWQTERSRGCNLRPTATGLALTASEIGPAAIRANIAGTPHSAVRDYAVVDTRVFHLSQVFANLQLGDKLPLICMNADKISGELEWSLAGVGTLEPHPHSATYTAKESGTGVVTVYDRSTRQVLDTCEIVVHSSPTKRIWIGGYSFIYEFMPNEGEKSRNIPPVTMLDLGKGYHLKFNGGAPGYSTALCDGNWLQFMALHIAMEFPWFRHFKIEGVDPEDVDMRDISGIREEFMRESMEIYEGLFLQIKK